MRYAFFGDIHGNWDAFQAVLHDMEDQRIDLHICLGDIVGYGAEPVKCLRQIKDMNCLTLAGNHDHAAIGKVDIEMFNMYAKQAALWTREQLSQEDREWLEGLGFVDHFPNFGTVHASLHGPEMFNYITTVFDAELSFQSLDKSMMFYGHTHIPVVFFDTAPIRYTMAEMVKVSPEVKTLVNVGSVGQPRDEDPRASYGIYDDEEQTITIRRIEYDVLAAGRKIIDAGLPEALAIRLELGK
jgi:predicted phosphodiesterase